MHFIRSVNLRDVMIFLGWGICSAGFVVALGWGFGLAICGGMAMILALAFMGSHK